MLEQVAGIPRQVLCPNQTNCLGKMIPKALDIPPEDFSLYVSKPTPNEAPEEPEVPGDREANFAAVAVAGLLLVIFGLIFTPVSVTGGLGTMVIGVMIMIGVRAVEKVQSNDGYEMSSRLDSEWERRIDAQIEASEMENDLRSHRLERQKEIDEIVKAVKATIMVRCRYCGTLNEEKANKCESCGGSL